MANMIDVLSRTEDKTTAGVIRNVLERSPIASFWHLEHFAGLQHTVYQRGTYPEADFRRFNNSFSEKESKPLEPIRTQVHDFGVRYKIDPLMEQEQTRFGVNFKAQVVQEASESLALDLKKSYLGKYANTTDNKTFGVYQWIDEYDSANNDVKVHIQASGTDADLSTATAGVFVARMQQLIDLVQPSFFVTNRNILSQISQLANGTSNDYLGGRWGMSTIDVLGRPVRVYTYEGIPVMDIGEDSQDAQIMGFDETDGSGSVSSSIVGVRADSRATVMLHFFQNLVQMREYTQDTLSQVELSSPHAIEVRQKAAAGRIFGILAA